MQTQLTPEKEAFSQVLNHLERHKTLTSWEAISLYRCTRLSAYIHRLRERGYNIKSEWKTRNGKRFTVYELIQ